MNEQAITTHEFFVHGMYCKACETLTQMEAMNVDGVQFAKVDLRTKKISVTGIFPMLPEKLAIALTGALSPYGYAASLEPEDKKVRWADFLIAFPAAVAFVALYIFLQKAGVVRLVRADAMSYATAFLIGVVASVSTCMAVVGGMVLSVSANYAKSGHTVGPQMLFHLGRFLAFFLLGGAIGAAGSIFQLSATAMFVLTFAVGLVMLLLGIRLLDVWPSSLSFTLPPKISTRLKVSKSSNPVFGPLAMGAITFVLPCAFTQAMQFYTLSSGGFLPGALTMTMFALGTFPVLALLSFGSLGFRSERSSSVFFKTAGISVIAFAAFNIINSLAIAGLISPVFSF
jgi:sulfite exporter TauE/SafE/copper chaperone CopZ